MVDSKGNPDNTDKKRLEKIELFRRGITGNTPEKPPASRYITWFHSQASYRSPTDLHHQIGKNAWDAAAGNHSHLLDELTNVNISSPGSGQVLQLSAGTWVNATVSGITPTQRGQLSRTTSGTVSGLVLNTYKTTGLTGTLDTGTTTGMVLGTTDTLALKNNSGGTRIFRVYASADAKAGNNEVLGVKLARNGTPIDESECRAFAGSANQFAKLVTNWMVSLNDGDEIAIFIANHSSTTNIVIDRCRIVALSV
jgi:hypothetical protein